MESLEDFYVRVVSPSLVAVLIAAGMIFFFSRYAASPAWAYLAFMILLGLGVPVLSWALSRSLGARLVLQRAALGVRPIMHCACASKEVTTGAPSAAWLP